MWCRTHIGYCILEFNDERGANKHAFREGNDEEDL